MNNFDYLLPQPAGDSMTMLWGTVTADGSAVLLDGDTVPLPASTPSLVPLRPSVRVAVDRYGKGLRIIGEVSPPVASPGLIAAVASAIVVPITVTRVAAYLSSVTGNAVVVAGKHIDLTLGLTAAATIPGFTTIATIPGIYTPSGMGVATGLVRNESRGGLWTARATAAGSVCSLALGESLNGGATAAGDNLSFTVSYYTPGA